VLLFVCWPVCSCCCIRLQSAPRLFALCRRSIRRAPCRDLAYCRAAIDWRKDACSCNAQLLGGVIDTSSLPSLQCRVRFWGHNEASSPYAGCTGLHFDSTTVALPALTTINKCLIFLEREKSIGRLRTSRQPTTASR
jgi:hypothetical protein